MISRKCQTLFIWSQTNFLQTVLAFVVVHLAWFSMCQGMTAAGDIMETEVSTIVQEILQADDAGVLTTQVSAKNPCAPFTNFDPVKREFFHPGYPNEFYPNNQDCWVILTAPEGHLVVLDFRDWFDVESSAGCKNDFLEIRDGPHGFNKLCNNRNYCGKEYPPMIQSSDRSLWIHFKSDDNIEGRGFKAVYDFIPRPPSLAVPEVKTCYFKKEDLQQGVFGKSDIPQHIIDFDYIHDLPIDCVWEIEVKVNWKIHLQFQKFSLEKPNDCEYNYIQVFSDKTDIYSMDKKFCGSMADYVLSKHNLMFVRFFNEAKANKSHFEANFTAYRENEKNKPNYIENCGPDEFDCDDQTCISSELRCNQLYNCRFRWDEADCVFNKNEGFNNEHIAIIMSIFSLILAGMCFTFIFNCVKKLIRDHRTIQEYIRQSREQQLNELDKQDHAEKKSKHGSRSRSGSFHSIDRFDPVTSATTPCYVPGGELLPILIRKEHSIASSNGDGPNQTIYGVDSDLQPEMCDSACQTRESLFTTQGYSSGNSTPNHSVRTNSPPAPFSTFGYKKEKFKAEAKIEMTTPKVRPYSVQTTKSAPDVIVTH